MMSDYLAVVFGPGFCSLWATIQTRGRPSPSPCGVESESASTTPSSFAVRGSQAYADTQVEAFRDFVHQAAKRIDDGPVRVVRGDPAPIDRGHS
jgi:hypothetical protein